MDNNIIDLQEDDLSSFRVEVTSTCQSTNKLIKTETLMALVKEADFITINYTLTLFIILLSHLNKLQKMPHKPQSLGCHLPIH